MKTKKWNGLPIVIFGVGGLAKKIKATIEEINKNNYSDVYDLKGFISNDKEELGKNIQNLEIISTNEKFVNYAKKYNQLGVVLAFGNSQLKSKIYEGIKDVPNIVFPNIIHPKSILYKENLKIGIGNQIIAGVNICTDVRIGNFNLINLNSTIGHDVKIKNFIVINPLVSISGNTVIEDEVLVGTGANILQGLEIGENSIVGAGSVVTKNVLKKELVIGIPAKKIVKNNKV